jgi:hypothetical protein
MMAKFLKSVIVLAVTLTFFGGTAMADRWGRDSHHPQKRQHYQSKHQYKAPPRYDHRRHVQVVPARPHYQQPRYHASNAHSLAPRVVFVGPLPILVPPPPHEVIGYLTGH